MTPILSLCLFFSTWKMQTITILIISLPFQMPIMILRYLEWILSLTFIVFVYDLFELSRNSLRLWCMHLHTAWPARRRSILWMSWKTPFLVAYIKILTLIFRLRNSFRLLLRLFLILVFLPYLMFKRRRATLWAFFWRYWSISCPDYVVIAWKGIIYDGDTWYWYLSILH